jgi:hypothetical protein
MGLGVKAQNIGIFVPIAAILLIVGVKRYHYPKRKDWLCCSGVSMVLNDV